MIAEMIYSGLGFVRFIFYYKFYQNELIVYAYVASCDYGYDVGIHIFRMVQSCRASLMVLDFMLRASTKFRMNFFQSNNAS